MAPNPCTNNANFQSKNMFATLIMGFIVMALLMPSLGMAQELTETQGKVCGFFQNINGLLNAASVVVVTIAVIFSGYQIAFAHKRIAEVAPAMVGGVLIGAAAQVAKMVVGGSGSATACTSSSGAATSSMVIHFLQHYV